MDSYRDVQKTLDRVFQEYGVKKAILFGSYAKGDVSEKSDVDLYVESDLKGLSFVAFMEAVRGALGGKTVDLINKTHIKEGSKIEQEIMKTGIVVYEG